mgnify:CR=1 FL=1|tara:strand:- start:173 stop:529 length:357 start_codon:yes stop_codon:yes gene_type:complete
MAYDDFKLNNSTSVKNDLNSKSFYSLGSELYKFNNKEVRSLLGNEDADNFMEHKDEMFSYTVGWIPAGYEHRPDLISSVYYGTSTFWWMILLFNNITDPFEGLNTGDRILIPILSSQA